MNHGVLTLKSLNRFASIALLVCLVYQLGACPCGCLEHNAWVELFGLSASDHEHDLAQSDRSSAGISVADDHHDCTGEARPQYVNTARDVNDKQVEDLLARVFSVAHVVDCHSVSAMSRGGFHSTPPRGVSHALSRPITQVFRL